MCQMYFGFLGWTFLVFRYLISSEAEGRASNSCTNAADRKSAMQSFKSYGVKVSLTCQREARDKFASLIPLLSMKRL
ncbi:hypothetical protein C8J55DRAFT_497550 [Lentinula edodes]|uniref:Secreted protein n=1 Tax=Lentinula lateritia TaxID=40482 RepID=A0A9W9B1T9_9AGAR|nr:hypothetical protein C8J55DRAFT_497550 [Lentinula edodes]